MTLKLITVPYSFNKKLIDAYKDIFDLVNDNDWVCFLDCDTAFFEMSDFGHVIQEYINKYPDTGMFTSYATRCHYNFQTKKGVSKNSDSIKYYAEQIIKTRKELHLKVKKVDKKIAGHLIVMQKKVWSQIYPTLKVKAKKKNILGFDTQLSYSLFEHGFDIKLMRGILIFHYLRFLDGKNNKIK